LINLVRTAVFLLAPSLVTLSVADKLSGQVRVYNGASDASAAVAVGDDMFVVADDENNILRVYSVEK